jgi:hypothetical protein
MAQTTELVSFGPPSLHLLVCVVDGGEGGGVKVDAAFVCCGCGCGKLSGKWYHFCFLAAHDQKVRVQPQGI